MTPQRRKRTGSALFGIVAAVALALWLPSFAFAADRGLIAFEPVTFDGKTYKGTDAAGPFTKAQPTGLDKSDPNSATATLDPTVKAGTTYPWGSVGAKNGSFIENKTGKDICKIVVTATDGNTFETAPQVGGGFTAEVSKDKKTITFTAKEKKDCIKNGNWFWMQVPKSPQPGSGTPPTLEGSIAMLPVDPDGETAVVAMTADDAFVAALTGIQLAMADPVPSPSGTATASASPDVPVLPAPTASTVDSPTDPPSALPTTEPPSSTSAPAMPTWSPTIRPTLDPSPWPAVADGADRSGARQ
jgi:hypothetical protein